MSLPTPNLTTSPPPYCSSNPPPPTSPSLANNTLHKAWGWGAKAGLFYAGTNLLCNIWCWFRLPETKDRTFGEIDLLFENKVHARKFRYTKVDRKWHPPTDRNTFLFSESETNLHVVEFAQSSDYVKKEGYEGESKHVDSVA